MSGKNTTPDIDQLAKKSFIFTNAFTDKSWSNVSGFLQSIPSSFVDQNGYSAIGYHHNKNEGPFYLKIGLNLQLPATTKTIYGLDYFDDLKKVKRHLLGNNKFPFYVEVHNKIMHFPYGKAVYPNQPPVRYLISSKSVNYIKDYEANFLKFSERLPFSFFLGNISKAQVPEVLKVLELDQSSKNAIFKSQETPFFVGLLNNKSIINRWKNSAYFQRDLEVIKELYDFRLKIYDESLKEILNLYDDKNLKENTVIIFTGDHGEAFFEHGYMIHGETVYDEMLNFPLLIKFPGQSKSIVIDQQFFQEGIATIVKKIMTGELNKENFVNIVRQNITYPFIFSKTCSNGIRGVRYNNEWKYIIDSLNNKKFLFDLKKDPEEFHDIYAERPEISAFIEENYIESSLSQSKSKLFHFCNEM